MKILLDTCTFLWIISDHPSLSQTARMVFENPENEVYLSSISIWEATVKYKLGKLPLPDLPSRCLVQKRKAHGVLALSLDEYAPSI